MTKEDIKTFAPVSIPTLCRYEHFKRCIESLSRCTWAEYTDVYVALDYPAKESHWDGYRKIKAYLETCGKMTFKSLNVVMRDKNYGFGPNGNHATLIKELWKEHDRRIGSEDDNEFSPNFLVYMNTMLELFKNDEKVYCVCGYNRRIELPESFQSNFYIDNDYVAWGVGFWRHKQMPEKYRTFEYLKEILKDKKEYAKLQKHSPNTIRDIVAMIKQQSFHGDVLVNVFETLEGMYSVMPTVSKVRNHGNDGTGLHSKTLKTDVNEYFSRQTIDESYDFVLSFDSQVLPTGIKVLAHEQQSPELKRIAKEFVLQIDLFLLRHFGKVPRSKYI